MKNFEFNFLRISTGALLRMVAVVGLAMGLTTGFGTDARADGLAPQVLSFEGERVAFFVSREAPFRPTWAGGSSIIDKTTVTQNTFDETWTSWANAGAVGVDRVDLIITLHGVLKPKSNANAREYDVTYSMRYSDNIEHGISNAVDHDIDDSVSTGTRTVWPASSGDGYNSSLKLRSLKQGHLTEISDYLFGQTRMILVTSFTKDQQGQDAAETMTYFESSKVVDSKKN